MESKIFELGKPLPSFRKDLKIHRGPDEADGSPTYTLFDSLSDQYYKLSWSEMVIVRHLKPSMLPEQLFEVLNTQTTIKPTMEQLQLFFELALKRNLLKVAMPSEYYLKQVEAKKNSFLWWLLMHYLYIRVPLVNPAKFLANTLHYVKFLASIPMLLLYAMVTIAGLFMVAARHEEYFTTILYFFNLDGLIWYSATIIVIKIIHEMSHGYTAAAYGVRVPAMGVAFIVLWPVLFTDVTDSWKMTSRKKRLLISAAGVMAETILAGICTFAWALSEPGLWQSVFYVLSTTSWMSTLLLNINPAMRFDGYYILSDLWGIDNLQTRAFAMARWKMHQLILGIKNPPPEEDLEESTIWGMVVYAIYTMLYRLFLYTTVAVFVYFAFAKGLGIFLFLSEIAIFMIWPFITEIQELIRVKKYIHWNTRVATSMTACGLIFLWIAIPFPHQRSFVGISAPLSQQIVYVPQESSIKKILTKRGETVKAGQVLLVLHSFPLEKQMEIQKHEQELIKAQINALAETDKEKAYIPEKQAASAVAASKYQALKKRLEDLTIKSDINGKVYSWNKHLFEGEFIPKQTIVGKVANPEEVKVVIFLPEDLLHTIQLKQRSSFWIPSTGDTYYGTVRKMDPFNANMLEYLSLASVYQGELPVFEKEKSLRLIESYYVVEVELDQDRRMPPFGVKGDVTWRGPWESYAGRAIKYLRNLFIRESGF